MNNINERFLELDGGELPPPEALGSEDLGASGSEVASADLNFNDEHTDKDESEGVTFVVGNNTLN